VALIYFVFFGACCVAMYYAGNWIVESLARLAKILRWKEFVVAFLIMAMAATLPNLFLALVAVLNGVPELSLGDVMGGNVVDMTLTIALAVFFSKKGIDARGEVVQTSLMFTSIAAIMPLVLILDGSLSRIDGVVLLVFFFAYLYWLLSKKERFSVIYSGHSVNVGKNMGLITRESAKIFLSSLVLIGVAQAIIVLAEDFSASFMIPLSLVGILIVGLGNSMPEIYFSITAARANKTKMILGDVMGAIILPGTLVLGLVALLSPFSVDGATMFLASRYFLLIAAILFFVCIKTDQRVTKREGLLLLTVYIAFLITEIFVK
jgi:cation:H+ antiporter